MIRLEEIKENDIEQFVKDNQEAFNYGAMEEFGLRDDHLEEDGQIISRETIINSIFAGTAYRIYDDDNPVGGCVVRVEGNKADLDLLFVSPKCHSKGIGYKSWCLIDELYPDVDVWETVTPYFEKRNIHFYVNRCGFKIVEYYNKFHKDPHEANQEYESEDDGMFRFEKVMNHSKMESCLRRR